MKEAIISAGSNISPEKNIRAAREILSTEQVLLKASRPRRTMPVPPAHGGEYLNCAFLIETDLDMAGLGAYLKGVEERLGRVRGPDRYAPRTIDLDIIVYNGAIVDEDYYRYGFVREAVDGLMGDRGPGGPDGEGRDQR